jgi:enoyl-CoA hydratase/carnithine racemase
VTTEAGATTKAALIEVHDRIATITLNRPDRLNAINGKMREDLWAALERVQNDDGVWVAVITGAGRAFSTGHDLIEMAREKGPEPGRSTDDLYVFQAAIWKPIIAAINGPCLAQGGGIALSSDIRIASEQAYFGWPQVKRGIGSISAPAILSHQIPASKVFELVLTGEFIDAQEAHRVGLVNKVVPHEQLMDAAMEMARKIAANAPLAVSAMKQSVAKAMTIPTLAERVKSAREILNRVNDTEDAKEGLAAFAEKRPPVWQRR